MDKNIFYVYTHRDHNNVPYYVGFGSGLRCMDSYQRSKEWKDFVFNLGYFYWNIEYDGLSKLEALELESFLIDEIGIDNLINKSRKHSEETKRKLSAARKTTGSRRPVICDKKRFNTVKSAAMYFGVSPGTIIYRIKSNNWEYFYE